MKPAILFLVGPTATGKSKIALQLARRLDGEIVSADSMLVYRGMDIGTAKPSPSERRKIPHHLIDILPPSRSFSVFEYRRRALAKIREIVQKQKLPIVVGGTGLYVRALLHGLSETAGPDRKFRLSLQKEIRSKGLDVLYERLCRFDPVRASQIERNDQKRIIRALEIIGQTRQRPSALNGKQESLESLGFRPFLAGISKDRNGLYRDIEARVDRMFKKGLVREIRNLKKKRISLTASQAVGYKEVFRFLDGGATLPETKDLIKRNTRRLAKRQRTWFKKEAGIRWYSLSGEGSLEGLVSRIADDFLNAS